MDDLRQRFTAAGITPAKFCAAIGISRHAALHWLAGRRPLPRYADILLSLLGSGRISRDDLTREPQNHKRT